MAMLVADIFTDNIGINILSFLDHKTEMKYKIKLVEDKLNCTGYDEELVYQLECLHSYLNDPTVWITGDMVDDEDVDVCRVCDENIRNYIHLPMQYICDECYDKLYPYDNDSY